MNPCGSDGGLRGKTSREACLVLEENHPVNARALSRRAYTRTVDPKRTGARSGRTTRKARREAAGSTQAAEQVVNDRTERTLENLRRELLAETRQIARRVEKSESLLNDTRSRVVQALSEIPVEAGVSHAAETLVGVWLTADARLAGNLLCGVFRTLTPLPLRADFLLILGRALAGRGPIPDWAYKLASEALMMPHLEIRDAAIRVLETWGGPRAGHLLRTHLQRGTEPQWLAEYVEEILQQFNLAPA